MSAALVAVLLVAASACTTHRAPNRKDVLDPLPRATRPIATRGDYAAARLMEAALGHNDSEMKIALEQVKMIEPKLSSLAQDLANTTLDDPIAYREASTRLLDFEELHPLLRGRLKEETADDPIRLANKRIFDHWHTIFARTFNAVAEPIGTSVITGGSIVPYKLAMSLSAWALAMWEEDPLTLPERQALVHRKLFLEQHPDAPNADKVRKKVAGAEHDLARTRERHFLYSARLAMDRKQPKLAEFYAARALKEMPENRRTLALKERAAQRVAERHNRYRGTVGWDADLPEDLAIQPELLAVQVLEPSLDANFSSLALFSPTAVRQTAEALLLPGSDLSSAATALRAADPKGELSDEADYIEALGEYESGLEKRSWQSFQDIARQEPAESNMARHAIALVSDPWQNPYGSFHAEKRRGVGRFWTFHLLGHAAKIRRYKALPRFTGYLLGLPQMAQALLTAPARLIAQGGKSPDFKKGAAVAGYRYLERFPQGSRKEEMVGWLYGYESKQKNWRRALRLADSQPDFDPEDRQELVDKAASQMIQRAGTVDRRDLRGSMLRTVARDYPDSDAGHSAGEKARRELETDTPQRIRMTRGFLKENPAVSGQSGLGVRESLVDGELKNGELHPMGVTFLGGRFIQVALVNPEGDEDGKPVFIERQVSEERLARAVTMLDEMSIHNARIDRDYTAAPDAQRDMFFERARLGLTGVSDRRPLAKSTFVYEGVRERYGMVRSREPILPFDLVFKGSIDDLGLGAFPRWRTPKRTPDAFMYRN